MDQRALRDAAIVGIGRTPFVRKSGRSTLGMAARLHAPHSPTAGSRPATSTVSPATPRVTRRRRCRSRTPSASTTSAGACSVAGGGNAVASVVAGAAAAVVTGQAEVVVVYRVPRLGHALRQGARRVLAPGEGQFAAPHGYIVPPQWFAMWCRRHQHVYGSTAEDLGAIAVQQRAHAVRNPHADRRGPRSPSTTTSTVAGSWSRSGSSTAATRSTVRSRSSSLRRARAADLAARPVHILGVSDANGQGGSVFEWDDMTAHVLPRRGAAALAADRPAAVRHGRRAACTTATRTP